MLTDEEKNKLRKKVVELFPRVYRNQRILQKVKGKKFLRNKLLPEGEILQADT